MAEVVRSELQLEPVAGLATLGRRHDAGIVDQEIDTVVLPGELRGELSDEVQAGEIELPKTHRAFGIAALIVPTAASPFPALRPARMTVALARARAKAVS